MRLQVSPLSKEAPCDCGAISVPQATVVDHCQTFWVQCALLVYLPTVAAILKAVRFISSGEAWT